VAEALDTLTAAAAKAKMTAREFAYFLATAWHESGLNPSAVGDGGTSFGLFQMHAGGAGGKTVTEARRYLDPQLTAANRAPIFQRAHVDSGAEAAAVQRPANRGAYAAAVDKVAAGILTTGKLPNGQAIGGSSSASSAKRGQVTGDTAGLDAGLLSALQLLAGELGKSINVVSGKRTRAEQATLYARFQNGTGNVAAKPGQSNHESGKAADAYVGGVPLKTAAGSLAGKYGLTFPVAGEAWHVEHDGSLTNVVDITPGFNMPGFGDAKDAVTGSLMWVGENLTFVALLAVGVSIGGLLIVGGAWRALDSATDGQATQAATMAATRGASKGAGGAKGAK
jgi:hypothetical protein